MFHSVGLRVVGCGFGPGSSNLRGGGEGEGRNPLGNRNVKVVSEFFSRAG